MQCCDFKLCRRHFDGNCNATENERESCEYRLMKDAIEKASEMNQYKVYGELDTYNQYNEAWQDCIELIKSNALMG